MHAAVQILMEEQGQQESPETVQAIADEPRSVKHRQTLKLNHYHIVCGNKMKNNSSNRTGIKSEM